MSGQIININERRENGENKVSVEEIKLPQKLTRANWRDDVEETAKEIDEEIGYETFKDERNYKSQEHITMEAEAKIEDFNFSRSRLGRVGGRVLRIASYQPESLRKVA